jgi:hypothetical protein
VHHADRGAPRITDACPGARSSGARTRTRCNSGEDSLDGAYACAHNGAAQPRARGDNTGEDR